MAAPSDQHQSKLIASLIIIACAGLLIALLMRKLAHSPTDPNDEVHRIQAAKQIQQITQAVKFYLADHDALPSSLDKLIPKYLPSLPTDPWGHPYVYDQHREVAHVTCYGKNGKPRGYGIDLDIITTIKASAP